MKSLFSEFDPTTKKEWLEKVEKDLKGKPLESLDWVFEGEQMTPFYHSKDVDSRPVSDINKKKNTWQIGEYIDLRHGDKKANEQAIKALQGGCNALLFDIRMQEKPDLDSLLKNIQLEWIETHFITSEKKAESIIDDLSRLSTQESFDLSKIKGSIRVESELDSIRLSNFIESKLPGMKCIHIGNYEVRKNESITEELTKLVTEVRSVFEGANKNDISLLAQNILVTTSLTDHYFGNIAKIRALNELLSLELNKGQLSAKVPIEVHVCPQNREDDDNLKIIQANSHAMAAIIGGADRIFIGLSNEESSPFQRRIARNIQHLMAVESHLDQVIDPAGGSYFIEHLTQLLVEKAGTMLSGHRQQSNKV